jgi:hypothetical protein
VGGRKGVPQVVYARIWRWPNINKSGIFCCISSKTIENQEKEKNQLRQI